MIQKDSVRGTIPFEKMEYKRLIYSQFAKTLTNVTTNF